jgi:hypothetical protein
VRTRTTRNWFKRDGRTDGFHVRARRRSTTRRPSAKGRPTRAATASADGRGRRRYSVTQLRACEGARRILSAFVQTSLALTEKTVYAVTDGDAVSRADKRWYLYQQGSRSPRRRGLKEQSLGGCERIEHGIIVRTATGFCIVDRRRNDARTRNRTAAKTSAWGRRAPRADR